MKQANDPTAERNGIEGATTIREPAIVCTGMGVMARVLLIDDEELVVIVLRNALLAAGHEVITAADGDQGLRALRRHPVDIIVTDIIMPGKEGIETILEIRRLSPTIPIIAMSGGGISAGRVYLESAARLGATRTLPKPFPPKRLLEEIDACLREGTSPSIVGNKAGETL